MNYSLLTPKLPQQKTGHIEWGELYGCAKSLAIANAAKLHSGIITIITPDSLIANQLKYELRFFTGNDNNLPIIDFPDWETLPYDHFSPHQDIISQRLKTLSLLPTMQRGILIVPITTLMHRIAPRDYLATHSLILKLGQTLDLAQSRQELSKSGYRYVDKVIEHGEFSIRGSIIDIFPMGNKEPLRIELFDTEIESMRTFDPETQLSIKKIDHIELLPAHELPLSEHTRKIFCAKWQEYFRHDSANCPIYQDIYAGNYTPGIEYYLPMFFNTTATLIDYLPTNTLIIRYDNIHSIAENFYTEVQERYQQLSHDLTHPILPPHIIFLSVTEIFTALKTLPQICIHTQQLKKGTGKFNFATTPPPNLTLNHKLKQPLQKLANFLTTASSKKYLFCTETEGRLESLLKLLQSIEIQPKKLTSWQDFQLAATKFNITVIPLDEGLNYIDFTIISESQLFGQRVLQRRRRKQLSVDSEAIVRNLTELNQGDPVVHIYKGIGRFRGLQSITVDNITDEYLTIEYADNNKLYVPVSSLHLISRYSGTDIEHAPLHKLGNKQWEKIKRKAQQRIRDVAAELLEIYARRAAQTGHAFTKPDKNYLAFAENFPFEETPDQQTAIQQVINDMQMDKPMDRLICGDVGFGKTEVAIRAAFIAVQDNKQVAVLVPTTLLAQQHYQSFQDRFANWPVNIEMLSRFRTASEQKKIITQLKDGKIDIIIATHKLIQKDFAFKNLGLLIIDEEHRFGVRQKEKIKSMRAQIDILTLTATPIPRTLNMSFAGIRDLSIIATPPQKRLSIKTFVQNHNQQTIREAILREIMRGGQVYFIHNRVMDIQQVATELTQLVPEARIGIAHGQMAERELEHIMMDFYHRRFNVLVCTTIIESGIDIPSANTIIINRADKFGLAQLHQMRGRVGRSHHQAYAYLFVPAKSSLTRDAKKRLEVIASLEDLGAGFTLATHDMEIRGAGELLGDEQSGHMQAIGFNLYMEMLEHAVKSLKAGKQPDLQHPFTTSIEIDLQTTAIIPEDYLPNVHERLILYKRIANAKNHDTLAELRVEMIDRFGLLPDVTKNLFAITELRLLAAPFGIKKIEADSTGGKIEFEENPNIDPATIINLIQKHPEKYKLASPVKLQFLQKSTTASERIEIITALLEKLAGHGTPCPYNLL